jgi:enamidase
VISLLSSLDDLPAEQALCLATGNTARMRELASGLIEIGGVTDLEIMGTARHSGGATLPEHVRSAAFPASA